MLEKDKNLLNVKNNELNIKVNNLLEENKYLKNTWLSNTEPGIFMPCRSGTGGKNATGPGRKLLHRCQGRKHQNTK